MIFLRRIINEKMIIRLTGIFFVGLMVAILLTAASSSAESRQLTSDKAITIVVVSDINESYGSTEYSSHVDAALEYIASLSPDLVICAGDMVAGQNLKLSEDNLKAMWQAFDDKIWQRLRSLRIPFVFAFGNHDGSNSSKFAHERRIAEEFFGKRRPDLSYLDDSCYPACYSFEFAGVYFAVIDASSARIEPAHKDWLVRQLTTGAAKNARLRVVVGHLPMYAVSEGRNRPGDVLHDADAMWALFDSYNVDYYISGHHHAFYPAQRGRVKMLSVGALGGGPRQHIGSEAPAVKTLTTLHLAAQSNSFQITSHDLTNGMKVIRASELPPEIHGFNGVLTRLGHDMIFAD